MLHPLSLRPLPYFVKSDDLTAGFYLRLSSFGRTAATAAANAAAFVIVFVVVAVAIFAVGIIDVAAAFVLVFVVGAVALLMLLLPSLMLLF